MKDLSARTDNEAPGRFWPKLLRWIGAFGALTLTLWWIDPKSLVAQLRALDPLWLAAALSLSVPLYALMALRWSMVARRLELPIPFGRAVREYYLASFVNQAVPSGLAGPALRAVRHARSTASGDKAAFRSAVNAVIIERIIGLLALCFCAQLGALFLWRDFPVVGMVSTGLVAVIVLVTMVGSAMGLRKAMYRSLVANGALLPQAVISFAIVILLVLSFVCAAHAARVEVSVWRMMAAAPLILASMLVPLSVAGWGIREASSAAIFAAMGLDATSGVVVSVAFGLIAMAATVPGAVAWLLPSSSDGGSSGIQVPSWLFPASMGAAALTAHFLAAPSLYASVGLLALVMWYARTKLAPEQLLANRATMFRVALIASIAPLSASVEPWALAVIGFGCFLLDAMDGFLARRGNATSNFGAELDKEADAFLVMILALVVATRPLVGPWVLAAGLWRYGYALFLLIVPEHKPAPRSRIGRYIHGTLVCCLLGALVFDRVGAIAAAAGTVLVSYSFLRSIWWTLRPGTSETAVK